MHNHDLDNEDLNSNSDSRILKGQESNTVDQGNVKQTQITRRRKHIIIGIVFCFVVIAVIVILFVIFGHKKRGAKTSIEAAEKFMKAKAAHDINEMIKNSVPCDIEDPIEDMVINYIKSRFSIKTSDIEEAFEYIYCKYDTIKLKNIETYVESYDDQHLYAIEQGYNFYDDIDVKIEGYDSVDVYFEYYNKEDDQWVSDKETFDVVKIDGKWYVVISMIFHRLD